MRDLGSFVMEKVPSFIKQLVSGDSMPLMAGLLPALGNIMPMLMTTNAITDVILVS